MFVDFDFVEIMQSLQIFRCVSKQLKLIMAFPSTLTKSSKRRARVETSWAYKKRPKNPSNKKRTHGRNYQDKPNGGYSLFFYGETFMADIFCLWRVWKGVQQHQARQRLHQSAFASHGNVTA
jgi:hypothetical protein